MDEATFQERRDATWDEAVRLRDEAVAADAGEGELRCLKCGRVWASGPRPCRDEHPGFIGRTSWLRSNG